MRCLRFLPVLLGCVLSFWISSCAPKAGTEPPVYLATISNEGPNLKVRYDLPQSQSELLLTDYDKQQRASAWKVRDNGFEFDGQKLIRTDGALFDYVTFDLVRDPKFFNRRYVVVDEIGPESWSLYLTAFRVQNQETEIKFQSNDRLMTRIGAETHDMGETYRLSDKSVMSYFGRAKFIKDDKAIIIAGPDIPTWLIEDVGAGVSQTMSVLEKSFEVPPVNRPTLYLTTVSSENDGSSKGGQLSDAVMTFRYRGVDFSKDNKELR
ncbi:hypothetical protein N9W89_14320, partial [Hellea sp.]|nr:hypothetical protein [Hellea sp.]